MTWREAFARFKFYSDIGQYMVRWAYQCLLAAGALRLVFPEIPRPWLVAVAPVILGAYFVVGYAHRRWGFMLQESVIGAQENASRATVVELVQRKRLFDSLGIPWNDIPREAPREVLEVLDVPQR